MNHWCEELRRQLLDMRLGKSGGKTAPHKAVLLLVVIDLIEQGVMDFHHIEYNSTLKEQFRKMFAEVVGKQKYMSAAEPYWHLRTSPFWVHRLRPGMEHRYDETRSSGGGDRRIRELIEYASFSYSARRALRSPECRMKVREILLSICRGEV